MEDVDEKNKKINKIKKKFLDFTKNKKGNLMDSFFNKMSNQSLDIQMEIYSFLDAAGWSGIHYAILFNYENIID